MVILGFVLSKNIFVFFFLSFGIRDIIRLKFVIFLYSFLLKYFDVYIILILLGMFKLFEFKIFLNFLFFWVSIIIFILGVNIVLGEDVDKKLMYFFFVLLKLI